jgi:phosphoribosylamine---glycine ligase
MAKILICTYEGMGKWFSLRLLEDKHSVDIYFCGKAEDPSMLACQDIVPDMLETKPDFNDYDLVLFDSTGKEAIAEEAASQTLVIGNGAFNKQAEDDRLYGLQIMEESGINVPFYEVFDDLDDAKRFVRKTKKTYVFKPFTEGEDQDTASTYVSKSPEDMLLYMDKLEELSKGVKFILQEVVGGTEISTEGWFNGEDFYLINATLEEKKFMDGGRGPNTGCSGNLVFVHDNLNHPLIFREGLGKMKEFLQSVDYKGMIDLNTIVSDRELYGLEWTPRFGYDATATLFNLIESDLGDFLGAVAFGDTPNYRLRHKFSAGVRISIPPYPTEIKNHHPANVPIQGIDPEVADIAKDYFLYDCGLVDDELVTMGISGLVCVVMANSETIPGAYEIVYDRINKLQIPNMQYRGDLLSCCNKRFNTLREQGWLR